MRLPRSPLLIAFSLLTSAATVPAQDAWMLWRRFIPADNPEANDGRLWRVQPGTKTKADCESEVKEYRALDPNKVLLDSAGRGYRIEDHFLPDSEDPRLPKTRGVTPALASCILHPHQPHPARDVDRASAGARRRGRRSERAQTSA